MSGTKQNTFPIPFFHSHPNDCSALVTSSFLSYVLSLLHSFFSSFFLSFFIHFFIYLCTCFSIFVEYYLFALQMVSAVTNSLPESHFPYYLYDSAFPLTYQLPPIFSVWHSPTLGHWSFLMFKGMSSYWWLLRTGHFKLLMRKDRMVPPCVFLVSNLVSGISGNLVDWHRCSSFGEEKPFCSFIAYDPSIVGHVFLSAFDYEFHRILTGHIDNSYIRLQST